MESLEELKLFQELKDSSLPYKDDSLDDLIDKREIYDINPNLNYQLLEKSIETNDMNDEDLVDNFLNYNQTLTFKKRKNIISKIKKTCAGKLIEETTGLNEKSYMEIYFNLLNDLLNFNKNNSKDSYDEIKKLFQTKYFVDNASIKIPLIYGTNELKYSGLINNMYQNLFYSDSYNNNNEIVTCKNEEKNAISKKGKSKNEKESKNSNKYPELIIQKKLNKDPKKCLISNNEQINENNKDSNNNNEMEIDSDKENENYLKFKQTIKFISEYLTKICDKEFYEFFDISNQIKLDENQRFCEEYKLSPQIDSLYFHLLFFDLIINIYSLYGQSNFDYSFHLNFFEKTEEKIDQLHYLQKYCKFILGSNKNYVDFKKCKKILNENYIMIDLKDSNNTYTFNPYDFILGKINNRKIKNYDDIVNAFNNQNIFSLNKIYKDQKKLFKDEKLFNLFKEDVEQMLTSNVVNQLYNQYENYKAYNNPFQSEKKEQFLKQTFDIMLYLPIPFQYIAGFTYKNFGIIFINNKILSRGKAFADTFFLKQICNISFRKVVIVHEVIGHYCSSIIHGNEKSIQFQTHYNTFLEYEPTEDYEKIYSDYDGGERGESLLFGNKIKFLFIKGALYILNSSNWDADLDTFRSNFIKLNNPSEYVKEILDINKESENNKIVNQLLKKSEDYKGEKIVITISNSYFRFRRSNNEEEDEDEQVFSEGVLYWDRLTHKNIIFKKRTLNK